MNVAEKYKFTEKELDSLLEYSDFIKVKIQKISGNMGIYNEELFGFTVNEHKIPLIDKSYTILLKGHHYFRTSTITGVTENDTGYIIKTLNSEYQITIY